MRGLLGAREYHTRLDSGRASVKQRHVQALATPWTGQLTAPPSRRGLTFTVGQAAFKLQWPSDTGMALGLGGRLAVAARGAQLTRTCPLRTGGAKRQYRGKTDALRQYSPLLPAALPAPPSRPGRPRHGWTRTSGQQLIRLRGSLRRDRA